MKERYIEKQFRTSSLKLIELINGVIEDYSEQGYSLTLRQLYYQLVARDIIPNTPRSYKNVGNLINDARLAGLIDWRAIEDRTRNLCGLPHWNSPEEIIKSAAYSYRKDNWEGQFFYVEVWVEKEALSEVVGKACDEYDTPYFCCRGYTSQTEMYNAAQRIKYRQKFQSKECVVIHLGDHDPSGIDMSRDIEERLEIFGVDQRRFQFNQIALNMNQIDDFNPPPNPAKITDSRCAGYIKKFGYESWELDALEPKILDALIKNEITKYLNMNLFRQIQKEVEEDVERMHLVAKNWEEVVKNYGK